MPNAAGFGFTFPDEHQRDVGEWSEIATGADTALRGNDGRDAAIQEIAKTLRDDGANTGKSLGEHIGADEHHAADFIAGERGADTAGVRADHVALQLLQFAGRDTNVGQQSDAGVDGVHRIVAGGEPFDHGAGVQHRGQSVGINSHRLVQLGYAAEFIEGETGTVERYHLYLCTSGRCTSGGYQDGVKMNDGSKTSHVVETRWLERRGGACAAGPADPVPRQRSERGRDGDAHSADVAGCNRSRTENESRTAGQRFGERDRTRTTLAILELPFAVR